MTSAREMQHMQLPPYRRLRGYAFDPSLQIELETAVTNQVIFKVPWECNTCTGENLLGPGPVGEYLEVIDYDPASGCFYAPVDLDNMYLLAQDGLAPSEGNPQFHQQMVYAVAMTTIRNFERALGRLALWSPRVDTSRPPGEWDVFVRRLRIYPHAMREANAYYSPEKKALLFGYFPATADDPGSHFPGGIVFTCLSHDVIAHETTHALLDGIHPHYREASNADLLAFHEAFADIVALFQHFTFPEVLHQQIAKTRGDLASQNLLAELAHQFGQAIGSHGALRDALGKRKDGKWEPKEPKPEELEATTEPHARGAILVAAIFDAFLSIYKSRIADLLRIASNGTGVLQPGEIHPDLVNRLASEASKSAQHVLNMCIRALDYCPPVDLTFGEYLRALITADYELVRDDDRGYRIAVIEAFRRRGIYPHEVRTLSVESLRWQGGGTLIESDKTTEHLHTTLKKLVDAWKLSGDRKKIFNQARDSRNELHDWLEQYRSQLQFKAGREWTDLHTSFEVHSVRPARRIGPDGRSVTEMVIEIIQRRPEPGFCFYGGSTVLLDMETGAVRYSIYKNLKSRSRLERQREFLGGEDTASLRAMYFGAVNQKEPFAFLHRATEEKLP